MRASQYRRHHCNDFFLKFLWCFRLLSTVSIGYSVHCTPDQCICFFSSVLPHLQPVITVNHVQSANFNIRLRYGDGLMQKPSKITTQISYLVHLGGGNSESRRHEDIDENEVSLYIQLYIKKVATNHHT